MSLARMYCKEILRQVKQFAVYTPGRQVSVGDIIRFERKRRPIGDYHLWGNLSDYGDAPSTRTDQEPDPYVFSSRRGVGMSFSAGAEGAGVGKGKLDISFSKEGATYLAAADCVREEISSGPELHDLLRANRDKLDWGDYFIVTSVTTAKRALIMQSSSASGGLTIEGDVNGLQPGLGNLLNADLKLEVTHFRDAAFMKNWSPDVAIFFKLVRYRQRPDVIHFESLDQDVYEMVAADPMDFLDEPDGEAVG